MNLLYVSIVQLSKYKIFLGHSIFNSILLSSWLVFNIRGKTTILNLFHTIKMLKISYKLIKHIINGGFPLWYINFDLTKEWIIEKNANIAGEFYLTRKWIRGLISNYYVITKAYRQYLVKKEFMEVNKVKDIYDKWLFTRFTWPRAIFISNVNTSHIVAKEAATVKVPTIALVDTNTKTFSFNVPIGCNDDSVDSIAFMVNIISWYIIKCKYKRILVWYYFKRNINRFHSLVHWSKKFIIFKKNFNYKINLKKAKIPNFINYLKKTRKGLNFFFARSYNFKLLKKYNINLYKNINLDLYYRKNINLLYHKLKGYKYRRLARKYKIKYKRAQFLKKIKGLALFKSFLNNFLKLKKKSVRFKRIKIKKRERIEKRKITKSFSSFFYFLFFFYLNKFNIVIDYYKYKMFSIKNILRITMPIKSNQRYKPTDYIHWKKKRKKHFYIFRYKSKNIKYRRRRNKKYKYHHEDYIFKNLDKNRMSFVVFYWKYFILFMCLKIRNKKYNIKKKYNTIFNDNKKN